MLLSGLLRWRVRRGDEEQQCQDQIKEKRKEWDDSACTVVL